MSNDKSEPTEDDGWGEAAEAVPSTTETPEPRTDKEWADAANLEKRAAALRDTREQTPVSIYVSSEGGEAAAGGSEAPPSLPPKPRPEPDEPVLDEDAPQWTAAEDAALPAPSSDMLAAAGVIAQKDFDEVAKVGKKKKLKRGNERPPKGKGGGGGGGARLTTRQQRFLIGGVALLLIAAVCAVLGWFNSQNYYLTCGTNSIIASQGRFWPWGQSPLQGPAFVAIHVPSDVLCTDQHFDSRAELEQAFLDALLKQSTALLTSGDAAHVSTAEEQLEQALLLTRAPERSTERALVQRLQGDVAYWRGAEQIQQASELLKTAAGYFDEAASRRPRHSSDANAWAEHARFIQSEIDKGPRSLRKDEAPREQPHFKGLSPVAQPDRTTATDAIAEEALDAGVQTEPPDAAQPPADAALPRGGVLL
jgi:hypothetical protein